MVMEIADLPMEMRTPSTGISAAGGGGLVGAEDGPEDAHHLEEDAPRFTGYGSPDRHEEVVHVAGGREEEDLAEDCGEGFPQEVPGVDRRDGPERHGPLRGCRDPPCVRVPNQDVCQRDVVRPDGAGAVSRLEVRPHDVEAALGESRVKAPGRLDEVGDGTHANAAVDVHRVVDEALSEVVDAPRLRHPQRRALRHPEPASVWRESLMSWADQRAHPAQSDVPDLPTDRFFSVGSADRYSGRFAGFSVGLFSVGSLD